jgi:DNA-binding MarR family transcriptional regulator
MARIEAKRRTANGAAGSGGERDQVGPVPAGGLFPPVSTSLGVFVNNGSDRDLRRLIYSLYSLSMLMGRNREYFASYIGVSSAQYLMVTVIAENGDSTVSFIADRLAVSSQFVTMEVNKLIAKGMVAKRTNEADRRSAFLSLTAKGHAVLEELGSVRMRVNDQTFGSLDHAKARLLQEILDRLISDARAAAHALEAPDMRGRMAPSVRESPAPVETPAHAPAAGKQQRRARGA